MRNFMQDLIGKRQRRQRRLSAGMTLTEVMIVVAITSTVATMVFNMTMAGNRLVARHTREKSMEGHARSMLDEALRELRAADQVFVSRGINGTTFKTSKNTIVFEAPGYDPASSLGIIPGMYDLVAFQYDPLAKTLSQSTFVDTGSKRPRRTKSVLAKNVKDMVFTYRVRDVFLGDGGKAIFRLNARASSTPQVYVNGQRVVTGFVYSNLLVPGTISFNSPPADGADVQFMYTVDPAHDNGKWLSFVTSVDMTVIMWQAPDNPAFGTGTVTLSGNARLRNQRT